MKRALQLFILLAIVSVTSGYLMSQMSTVGRIGINLIHKEYKFLKVWWQGAAVVFAALMVLYFVQYVLNKAFVYTAGKIVHFLLFLAAVGGLYLTWADFDDDISHRLLRERFHIGAYLFWVGWMLISLYFITAKRKVPLATLSDKNPEPKQ